MNTMNKRKTQLILKDLEIKPNKKLGQNFLVNTNIALKIICATTLLTPREMKMLSVKSQK